MDIRDQAAVLSFARQQSHVLNTQVYEIEYAEMDYGSLIPINTNIPEWAAGMDTLIMDKVGEAKFQSTYAKDIPLADVNLNIVTSTFAEYAVGYQWNIGEVGKAQFSNFPLTARRAEAARFASEVFIWESALIGAQLKGWTGLINSAAVTPIAAAANGTGAPSSAWVLNDGTGNKTPEEIVADINNAVIGPVNAGNGILTSLLADTVLLPPLAMKYIEETPYGVTSPNETIASYVQTRNAYTRRTGRPLNLRELPALSRAATVGVAGGGRLVAYRNTADVLELPMPMAYRFWPIYQDGPFNFVVPGMGRIGQLDIKKPGIRYLDGITPVPAA
ncbi:MULTISPECIES: major capsid family protein [Xanthomonas]|uniref:DUF2184 domain-containing protein n=1 Tax=Xanthomonas prunicola TaxID=2053930 RepID=A0A9Q9IYT4_9XANT|nr:MULTISPECIES: major capsid family protein [Xanthomonas]UXA66017.1 DUF2184 domain-containing protein [Xanthomonas prunicola]